MLDKIFKILARPIVLRLLKVIAVFFFILAAFLIVMACNVYIIISDYQDCMKTVKVPISQKPEVQFLQELKMLSAISTDKTPSFYDGSREISMGRANMEDFVFSRKQKKIPDDFPGKFIAASTAACEMISKIGATPMFTCEIDVANAPEFTDYDDMSACGKLMPGSVEKIKYLNILGKMLLLNGNISEAIKSDRACLIISRAFLTWHGSLPRLETGIMQICGISISNNYISYEVYLKNNDVFKSGQFRNELKNSLLWRAQYIEHIPGLRDFAPGEMRGIKTAEHKLNIKYPVTMAILNFFYGSPFKMYSGIFEKLDRIKAPCYLEEIGIMKEYYGELKSLRDQMQFKEPGILSLPNFSTAYFTTHPLTILSLPGFHGLIEDFAITDAQFRLTTLGGLARIYYYENQKWPDLKNDQNFLNEAGLAAVDPIDNKPVRFKEGPDGSMIYYSVGINGVDDGGSRKGDRILNVMKPM